MALHGTFLFSLALPSEKADGAAGTLAPGQTAYDLPAPSRPWYSSSSGSFDLASPTTRLPQGSTIPSPQGECSVFVTVASVVYVGSHYSVYDV